MKKRLKILFVCIITLVVSSYANNKPIKNSNTVTDIDGNIYKTVKIGAQIWMAENLKVTHYRNGDPIPNATENATWVDLTTGAWCNYNNDDALGTKYGKLYNFYAIADVRNIAPIGWHVATDAEWTELTTGLGGENVAGGKLKEAGTQNWKSPNIGATNETGFDALPSIYQFDNDGSFYLVGDCSYWWTATDNGTSEPYFRNLDPNDSHVYRESSGMAYGFSVRCVRD